MREHKWENPKRKTLTPHDDYDGKRFKPSVLLAFLEMKRNEKEPVGITYWLFRIGRRGGIRTRDPLHPMQVRYQAALHAVRRRLYPEKDSFLKIRLQRLSSLIIQIGNAYKSSIPNTN